MQWQAAKCIHQNISLTALVLDDVGLVAQLESLPLYLGCSHGWDRLVWVKKSYKLFVVSRKHELPA